MNYTEFVNAVKEKLTQELNGGVRVNVYTTKKNNATERTGLILETPGVNISPTIYLEEFFELYEKGKQMDWIIEDLVELYEEIRQEKSWDYERMLSFEGVKDRIIFRLINTEKNKELLLDVPHKKFLDLSLVFAVLVEADNDGTAVMLIKDLHMRQWKVTKEQLWNAAKENTKRLLPAECFGMNFAVYELLSRSTPGEHDRENLLRRTWHIHEELELPEKDKMYVENASRATRQGNITLEELEPNPKNPVIANFFRNIGYADQLGSGVRNLFKYSRLYSGEDPEFIEGDIFKIIVPLNEKYSFDYQESVTKGKQAMHQKKQAIYQKKQAMHQKKQAMH